MELLLELVEELLEEELPPPEEELLELPPPTITPGTGVESGTLSHRHDLQAPVLPKPTLK